MLPGRSLQNFAPILLRRVPVVETAELRVSIRNVFLRGEVQVAGVWASHQVTSLWTRAGTGHAPGWSVTDALVKEDAG